MLYILGLKMSDAKKLWITEEIVILMKERWKLINYSNTSNQYKYKKLRNLIQRNVKTVKEQWINDICQEVEEYIKREQSDFAFK